MNIVTYKNNVTFCDTQGMMVSHHIGKQGFYYRYWFVADSQINAVADKRRKKTDIAEYRFASAHAVTIKQRHSDSHSRTVTAYRLEKQGEKDLWLALIEECRY